MNNCIISDIFMHINKLEFLHYIITTRIRILKLGPLDQQTLHASSSHQAVLA